MKLRTLLIAALAVTPVSAAETLQCPAGAQIRRDPNLPDGKRAEWCEDSKTKRQDGPAQLVDTAGTVLVNFEFRQGKLASQQFTRAGLEKMLAEVNAGFAKEGGEVHVALVDEHRLRFDMNVKGKLPGGAEVFRRLALTNAPICRMLAAPGTDFRTIEVQALNEKREPVLSTSFTRADCAKAAGQPAER